VTVPRRSAAGGIETAAPAVAREDARVESAPALAFTVTGVGPLAYAATPTLCFTLAIDAGGARIRSLSLNAELRIDAHARPYDADTAERLTDLFGHTAGWDRALRSLHWTQTTVVVPGFDGATTAELRVPCSYDFDVAATKYLHAVRDGVIPVTIQFSGSVFYAAADGALGVARLPWDREAGCALPAHVWRALMNVYFPNSAWLRVHADVFDRLNAFRAAHGLPGWDATLEALLDGRRA
jgi:Family of unknown function (DUF6084)